MTADWGFPDPQSPLLRQALTHSSAAAVPSESNERLEFLGDALISAFVARYLLEALPPDTAEGVLSRARTRIVRRETLAAAARDLGIAEMLRVGPGERKENRQAGESALADAYEAVVGALFLDAGYATAEQFVRRTLSSPLAEVTVAPPAPDPKSLLQIRLLAAGRGLPRYELIAETGTGNGIQFTAAVFSEKGTEPLGVGDGSNKRAAQTAAAHAALAALPQAAE